MILFNRSLINNFNPVPVRFYYVYSREISPVLVRPLSSRSMENYFITVVEKSNHESSSSTIKSFTHSSHTKTIDSLMVESCSPHPKGSPFNCHRRICRFSLSALRKRPWNHLNTLDTCPVDDCCTFIPLFDSSPTSRIITDLSACHR